MKVDIITCHNIKNYGSVYQTYATQKLIENLGYQVEVIDYQRKDTSNSELIKTHVHQSDRVRNHPLLKIVLTAVITPAIHKQIRVFEGFLEKYIHRTPRSYFSNEQLKADCPKADVYLAGSDQIWNSSINERIEYPYFLDFTPDNSILVSFSTSFGGKTALREDEIDITRKLLSRYKAISLREESGRGIVESLGIKNSVAVLDPTFLLSREEWKKIQEPIRVPDKYILVYHLRPNHEFDEYVKFVSKEKGMKAVHILLYHHVMVHGMFGPVVPTPGQVQTLIENASYIITDSFHMTAFSIKYHIQFVVDYPDMFTGRIENILKKCGLENRHLTDYSNLDILDEPIEYDNVDEIINREVDFAKNWLQETLHNCEELLGK